MGASDIPKILSGGIIEREAEREREKGREKVTWCFTLSQPVRLYQGERERDNALYYK